MCLTNTNRSPLMVYLGGLFTFKWFYGFYFRLHWHNMDHILPCLYMAWIHRQTCAASKRDCTLCYLYRVTSLAFIIAVEDIWPMLIQFYECQGNKTGSIIFVVCETYHILIIVKFCKVFMSSWVFIHFTQLDYSNSDSENHRHS